MCNGSSENFEKVFSCCLLVFVRCSLIFDTAQATPLEERPGNITNSSFTGFLLQQVEFRREEAKFKNFIIESLFNTNSFLRDNQLFSCKSEDIEIPT